MLASCVRSSPESTAASSPVQAAPSYVAQFDSLWIRFETVYPSFGYKGVNWQEQRALYRPRAQRARSQDEFVTVLLDMLRPLRDLHVFLIDPQGHTVPTYRPPGNLNFNESRWELALRETGYTQHTAESGEANIGGYPYLFIGSWKSPVTIETLDVMLAGLRDAPGLILDLRTNAGGSDATALAFASRFTRRAFTASYVQIRTDPLVRDVKMPLARTITPRGPWQFIRPVVVITGRGGFSATESFVAALRTLPHVTVIGDTTGGASGNPATFRLAKGWRFTVPRWLEFGPDLLPIEGRGVAPHMAIRWNPDEYDSDRDPLIDAAVGLLAERNGMYRIAPVPSR